MVTAESARVKERYSNGFRRAGVEADSRDLIPHYYDSLSKIFPKSRVDYISRVLTDDEIACISDVKDSLLIARIRRMSDSRLNSFLRYVPFDQLDFNLIQLGWMRDEKWFLAKRLGHDPDSREIFVDFMKNKNGERFRAYYCMKWPDRVKRVVE